MDELAGDDASTAEELLDQYLLRRARGEAESRAQFLTAHSRLRAPLERLLDEQEGVEARLTPLRSGSPGRLLGDFRIIREIGRGGMGIVYEAEQISLHRVVAVKVLPAHITLDARAVQRFQREATIAAKLHHPGIVDIYAVGEADGTHFFAMEFVEGTSIDRIVERIKSESLARLDGAAVGEIVMIRTLAPSVPRALESSTGRGSGSTAWRRSYIETVVRITIQVAEALDHAHGQGVVHRDVKPSNILVRPDGTAVITDFGIARELGASQLTLVGEFAGSVRYASPEQAMAGRMPVDRRADVFSLGVTLYEMLTLSKAFDGATHQEILSKIITKEPVRPSRLNPSLATDLETIVLKALEKDPVRRYASARAFADDLRAFLEYRPIQARRSSTFVRALRWTKRQPAKAALVTLIAVGAPAGVWLTQTVSVQAGRLAGFESERALETAFLDLAKGRFESARKTFDGLGSVPEGFSGSVLCLVLENKLDEARERILGADRATLAVPGIRWLRAFIEQARGDPTLVLELKGQAAVERDAFALYVRGWVELFGAARSASSEATLASPLRDAPPASGRSLVAPGSLFSVRLKEGSQQWKAYEAALREFELAVALSDRPRALYHYACIRVAVELRNTAKARALAEIVAARWSDSAVGWTYIGWARSIDDPVKALEAFRRARDLDPSLDYVHAYIGEALSDLGRVEEALQELSEQARRTPEDARTHEMVGFVLHRLGRFDEAVQAHRRAIACNPRIQAAHANLALAHFMLKEFDAAVAAAREAIRLEPESRPSHFHLGNALREGGRLDEAVEAWRVASKSWPDDAAIATTLGVTLLSRAETRAQRDPSAAQADVAAAIEAQRRALSLAPEDAIVHANLGYALWCGGDRDHAVTCYQRALELDPKLSDAYYRAQGAALERREFQKALQILEAWVRARPDDPAAWNELAWVTVDPSGSVEVRDVRRGLEAAETMMKLPGEREWGQLDTFACALAANGRLAEAVPAAERALKLAQAVGAKTELITDLEEHLAQFRSRRTEAAATTTPVATETAQQK